MAEYCHQATVIISFPFRMGLRSLAYIVEPLPGQNKNKVWLGVAIRVSAVFAAVVLIPIGVVTVPFALLFHLFSHSQRQMVSVVHNPDAKPGRYEGNTLSVRSHNLGFVYEFFRVVGDLRDVKTRANEIGEWLIQDENLPEVIFFQESFHIDGTKALVDKLKERYPYVVHSIAPHSMGLNNGGIIASQYPIKEFVYRPFDNMMGPERLSTRGLIKVRIEKNGKTIDVYGTHLQALLGKKRAEIRAEQMKQIVNWMTDDQTADGADQADAIVLLGDLNASKITAWGEESSDDDEVFRVIDENFVDVFGNDHDKTGKRTQGAARFVESDSPDGEVALCEPSGSWYIGPFANKGTMLRIKEWYERKFHHTPKKKQLVDVPKDHSWGTKDWAEKQHACTARFDFILRYVKNTGDGKRDRAEIRRVKVESGTQSAPSDHAPVDGVIHL